MWRQNIHKNVFQFTNYTRMLLNSSLIHYRNRACANSFSYTTPIYRRQESKIQNSIPLNYSYVHIKYELLVDMC